MERTRVLAFGTFDLLHEGHKSFLAQAAEWGTELFVVVARDATVQQVKGKKPVFPEKKRLNSVSELPFVSHCQLGNDYSTEKYKCVLKIKPDVIALGYDQKPSKTKLLEELKTIGWRGEIVRLHSQNPMVFKTTKLRETLGI